ncbi:hypothetical protein [Micromonospora robiginosa]|uniref:Uncharacterized protein n=1 Tax=Micromonospora robiginosa TaxID=2749844 RepID=A0A7L6B8W6_9ACTN|nr:hypothetical protein [Micromonospora ferruginea]QLQ37990.1 hypothetical protein H1D33_03600 [Micromonospora ferruginea]
MTQQHESRWSLAHTGNRVLLAVLVGLVVSFIGRQLDLIHGAVDVLMFLLVAAVTYGLVTQFRPGRR